MTTAAQVLDAPAPVTAPPVPAAPVEGAPPVVEAPKVLPTKTFEIAARKERALQRQREELAKEKAELQAMRAQIDADKARYTRDPSALKTMERLGFSYKDVTDEVLNDNQPTAEQIARRAEERVEKMEKETKDREEMWRQETLKQAEAAADEALAEFREELKEFIKGPSAEAFELVRLYEADDLVYDTMEEFSRRHKYQKTLSPEEACDLVEKYLEKSADKLTGASKIKAKFQTQGAQAPQEPGKPAQATAQHRTLHNGVTPVTTPHVPQSSGTSVMDAAMKRALAALGG